MKYTEGDTVKFKLKSGELLEGDVLFIERSPREDVLYINSSSKLKERLRKCCPKCNKLTIYYTKSTKKYRCWSCKAVFETPGVKVVQHREVARRRYNYTYRTARNDEEKSVIPLH